MLRAQVSHLLGEAAGGRQDKRDYAELQVKIKAKQQASGTETKEAKSNPLLCSSSPPGAAGPSAKPSWAR
jgi:hypothetical protein